MLLELLFGHRRCECMLAKLIITSTGTYRISHLTIIDIFYMLYLLRYYVIKSVELAD